MPNNYTILQFTVSVAGKKIVLDMPLFLQAVCMLRAQGYLSTAKLLSSALREQFTVSSMKLLPTQTEPCAPIIWQECKSALHVSIWPNIEGCLSLAECPDLKTAGIPELLEIF